MRDRDFHDMSAWLYFSILFIATVTVPVWQLHNGFLESCLMIAICFLSVLTLVYYEDGRVSSR